MFTSTNNATNYKPALYSVQSGAASGLLNDIAPSATSGVPLISQGAAAQSVFGTVVVAGGGTGATTLTGVLTGNGTGAVTASAVTQYGVVVGGATNAVASTAVGSAGQVLQSSGAGVNPAYSTPTYPSTSGTAGKILRSDGTNNAYTTSTYPDTNAVSTLLYASSANVIGALATANSGVLSTGATGVPSIVSMATNGALLIGGATPTAAVPTSSDSSITWTTGAGSLGATVTQATTSQLGGAILATAANVLTGTSTTLVPSVVAMIGHQGISKAWINFNGSGTTINDSFNVTSLTDNGAGAWTPNFTVAFATANYACTGASVSNTGTFANKFDGVGTGAAQILNYAVLTGVLTDPSTAMCAVFIGDR